MGALLRSPRVITASTLSDYCDLNDAASFQTPRYVTVGQLPAGIYEVRYVACVNAPPPVPSCTTVQTEQLVLQGVASGAVSIPAMRVEGFIAMIAALLCLGPIAIARR